MKIIVTGSLGNISKPLAQDLVQQGHEIVVISNSQEKQKDIEALGATAAIGSVESVDFLAALSGADSVYTMIPPNFAVPDPVAYYEIIGNSYAKAIKQSGIKRVVHLSSWSAHLPKGTGIIVGSHRVELILNELTDIAVTYLRPCSFYNNLYHYVDMIKSAGFMGTNYGGDDKVVLVSAKDIAAAALEEIVSQTTGNKIRYIASDERTCHEIAKVLGIAIGKPDLKWLTFTSEQVKETMEKNGVPSSIAAKLVELNASIRSGAIQEDYDLHQPVVMGKVKLEDFATEFAAAFK
ncbi:MAG: NmrA family NAD(P)-binding protein [Chitinophagaceae bacterium]